MTSPTLSHLLFPSIFTPLSPHLPVPLQPTSPAPFPLTYTAIAARVQLLPESLHVSKVQFVEGDGHLSYRVIPAESVVVQNLQVQSPLDHLLIGKP